MNLFRSYIFKITLCLLAFQPICLAMNYSFDHKLYVENYKSQNWGRFFGQALTYRAKNSSFPKKEAYSYNKETSNFDKITSLELMALSKHCQWQAIQNIANDPIIKDNKEKLPLVERAWQVIQLKQEFKQFAAQINQKPKQFLEVLSKYRDSWKIKTKHLKGLSTDKNVSVDVKPMCKGAQREKNL